LVARLQHCVGSGAETRVRGIPESLQEIARGENLRVSSYTTVAGSQRFLEEEHGIHSSTGRRSLDSAGLLVQSCLQNIPEHPICPPHQQPVSHSRTVSPSNFYHFLLSLVRIYRDQKIVIGIE